MGGILQGKKSNIAKMQMMASASAINAATEFAAAGPTKQSEATLESMELAKLNIGNYEPELNESRRLTDLGAQGVTPEQIEQYTNPYLQDVLDFSIRDMEDAAARRRNERRAITSKSGNDFASSGASPNRYQIEDDLADRSLYREIGGLSANSRRNAYDNATSMATNERVRQANAGVTYSNYANQTSQLGSKDVGQLAAVGQMQEQPDNRLKAHLSDTVNLYGTAAGNAQNSVNEYQKPSILSQIAGAAGSLNSIISPGYNMLSGGGGGGGGGSGGASASSLMDMGFGSQMASGTGGSDRRLKKDIRRVGTHPLGIGRYEWTYRWGQKAFGVMADEVRKVMPEAVRSFFGFDLVDYTMIGGA